MLGAAEFLRLLVPMVALLSTPLMNTDEPQMLTKDLNFGKKRRASVGQLH
jgi:hypothetical protein